MTETLIADALAARQADVPIQTRSARPTSFEPADFAAPSAREVNWKLSDLQRLAPLFVDEPAESARAVTVEVDAPAGVHVPSTGLDAPVRGEVFRPEDRPSAIAWKRSEDALHLRLPAGQVLEQPVRVRLHGTDATARSTAHIVIEAERDSHATVVLEHTGSAQFAQNVEIIVRDGASLTVLSLQAWEDDAVHAAAHQAVVGRRASLTHFVVSLGGAVVRVNPSVRLAGEGSHAELFGLSFADSGQHLESQVYLFHEGPATKGNVLYKSALQGAKARTVWIGDVLIGADAVDTDSYEANRNLVLTDGARADSIPNLEIETGEIAGAGHASATGRFDDEQLFYLRSRGISEKESRRLVVLGFLMEIVQKIAVDDVRARLIDAVEAELATMEVD
ncbi:Fe-S cluster assembly protein SufD [Microcella daejeonensis]|uniref:Fe-S cluster assembly protein SufD n=1 Tax=Microcella daejeonensis TaxID=2994971 RepID=A0A9E8MKL4_9MICO|nr:Fe-S cluster assembly protein SufD [Microcella daejeonensis]WAB81251.1 Fe-S cluster assembly protein SufD [Microcella daejeonensis]